MTMCSLFVFDITLSIFKYWLYKRIDNTSSACSTIICTHVHLKYFFTGASYAYNTNANSAENAEIKLEMNSCIRLFMWSRALLVVNA